MFSERSRASRGAADAASWPHRRPYKAYHEICGLAITESIAAAHWSFRRGPEAAHRGQPRHLNKANLTKTIRLLLRKAGLPRGRFHDLRHTHATFALQATKNIKAVSARLGHADVRVTLNTYAHYLPLMEDEYVSAMESLLETPQTPARTVEQQETSTIPN